MERGNHERPAHPHEMGTDFPLMLTMIASRLRQLVEGMESDVQHSGRIFETHAHELRELRGRTERLLSRENQPV